MRVALSSSPSPELPELDFFNTWKIAGGAVLLLDIVLVREIVTKSSLAFPEVRWKILSNGSRNYGALLFVKI